MSEEKEVIAYAITHAPPGVKGGPYEGEYDKPVPTLREAWRGNRRRAKYWLAIVRRTVPHARVIRIVRKARPSEASATLETARRRLAAVAESMTEHAYQEMASALEVDACRVEPSEASAVAVLRELASYPGNGGDLARIQARARRVLAAAGPDPMPVVRAAMRYLDYGPDGRLGPAWVGFREAGEAYRKAGGK